MAKSYSQIKPNGLSKMIHEALVDYTDEVQREIDQEAARISKETARKLSAASPERSGEYAGSWKVKKISEGTRWHSLSYVVHNVDRYQLTHLLEEGHALKSGGRTIGRVKPSVHIRPIEEEAVDQFTTAIERAIKR